MLGPWTPLIWSLVLLAALWWVSRRLTIFITTTLLLLTRSGRTTTIIYAIAILPGTLVHEISHWAMAKVVGVKTGAVDVLPRLEANGSLRLGSVSVRGGGLLQLTLIGLAPLLAGSALTMWLSYSLFDVTALSQAWQAQQWGQVLDVIAAGLSQPDALIALYFLFTVSDAMFLSASDREPVLKMLLYLGLILATFFALGLLPALPASWAAALQRAFQAYASGLAVALGLHAALALVFGSMALLLRQWFERQ